MAQESAQDDHGRNQGPGAPGIQAAKTTALRAVDYMVGVAVRDPVEDKKGLDEAKADTGHPQIPAALGPEKFQTDDQEGNADQQPYRCRDLKLRPLARHRL